MKTTLNILKFFCTLLVISMFVDFIKALHNALYSFFNGGRRYEVFNLQIPESWPDMIYYFLLITSLCLITYIVLLTVDFRQVVFNFSKDKVFTEENSKQLRKIGKGLVIYGAIILSFSITLGLIIEGEPKINADSTFPGRMGYFTGYTIGTTIRKGLPIFVVALFVQFISFIVVKGNVLQEENDLTI